MSSMTINMLQNYFNFFKLIVDKTKVSFSLSKPLRYVRGTAVYLHSFVNSTLDKGE
jgi:hypothetical protein